MTLSGTCRFSPRNRSKNSGGLPSESFRTDNPVSKGALFANHKPEKALEVSQVNRANTSPFGYPALERRERQPPPSKSGEHVCNADISMSFVSLADGLFPGRHEHLGEVPVCEREASVRASSAPFDVRAKTMNANEKVNILIVGNRAAKLANYEVMLCEVSGNVILAASAEEAIQCLLQTDVAVMLLDGDSSEREAFNMADAVLQNSLQKTPIIFILDAPLMDLDRYKEYRRGAVDFIPAPVVPELLRNKVSIFADLHCKTRQLETLTRELDLASEAVIVSDGDGSIEFWNTGAEALYGWGREEVLGKNLDQVVPTTFPVASEEVLSTLISAGQWEGTVRRQNKAGQDITVAIRKVLERIEGAGAVLEMGHDISAQLQAEETLRQIERLAAIGRLAGVIAHEINNPLEAIANALFLVRSHPSLKGEAQHFARLAEEEVARIQHITQQTLSFYRESQAPISVSIPTVLNDVLDLQARRLQINQILVEKEYRDDTVIMGFPAELKQVFLNLIGNATQAMPQGGRLRISTRESMDHSSSRRGVRVSVCDTGSGIQPKDAKRLFEPFFTTKPTNGTGLGLWVSKGIIEKYQGTIRFRSLRIYDQHVTCFSVFIPVAVLGQLLERGASCA